ncbi:MAG: ABC transporter substrate-binding protein [Actinobacteria bacterium]|nr:ABC transporter substrate-binding protein [Actinomycetota bacterium]
MRNTLVALVLSVSSLSLITGCRGAPSASLTVYSGQHPQLMAKLVRAFEEKTSWSVALRTASEQVLVSQVVTEASHSPADVVVTENAPAMNALAEHHLVVRLPSKQLAQLAVEARGPGRAWAGVSRRVNVLVYDAKRVKANELPRRIEDLAQGRFKGLLGLAPAESDFSPVVSAFEYLHGHTEALSWLTAMKANASKHLLPDNEALLNQMALGQIGIATMDQYYWYRFHHDGATSSEFLQLPS